MVTSAFGIDHGEFGKAAPGGLSAKLERVRILPRSERSHQLFRSVNMRLGSDDTKTIHGPNSQWANDGRKKRRWDVQQSNKVKTYNSRLEQGLPASPPKRARS